MLRSLDLIRGSVMAITWVSSSLVWALDWLLEWVLRFWRRRISSKSSGCGGAGKSLSRQAQLDFKWPGLKGALAMKWTTVSNLTKRQKTTYYCKHQIYLKFVYDKTAGTPKKNDMTMTMKTTKKEAATQRRSDAMTMTMTTTTIRPTNKIVRKIATFVKWLAWKEVFCPLNIIFELLSLTRWLSYGLCVFLY